MRRKLKVCRKCSNFVKVLNDQYVCEAEIIDNKNSSYETLWEEIELPMECVYKLEQMVFQKKEDFIEEE